MILDKKEYLSHISRPEDRAEMRRVLDLIEQTENFHTVNCTDFLEPNLVEYAVSILNRFPQIKYTISGGFCNAERQIISIYPQYHYYQNTEDLHLGGLKITGNISDLQHSDVLGSILGLGIKREKVGDIAFFDGEIKVAVHSDVYEFVLGYLGQIGREYVSVDAIDIDDLGEIEYNGIEKSVVSASMRLDALISSVHNVSRSKAKELIDRGHTKLNHVIEETSHIEAEVGDLVSVRRYGRFTVESIDGTTRSDRVHVTVSEPE